MAEPIVPEARGQAYMHRGSTSRPLLVLVGSVHRPYSVCTVTEVRVVTGGHEPLPTRPSHSIFMGPTSGMDAGSLEADGLTAPRQRVSSPAGVPLVPADAAAAATAAVPLALTPWVHGCPSVC